jgi:hypothetical protein
MKKIKYLALLFFLFVACTKDTPDTSPVVGQWIWFKSTGGLANVYTTPQNTGRSWGLKLNQDLTCFQSGDLLVSETGVYTLTEEINPQWTAKFLNITFPDGIKKYNYSFISQDTLRLDDHTETDGLSNFFVKH